MQVEVKVDASYQPTKVLILTDEMTEQINELVRHITQSKPSVLVGFQDERVSVLDLDDIVRFYAANQKVYAVVADQEYVIRLRLYELEERLRATDFVRISNAEIINLKKIRGFDLSFSGTICVQFHDGSTSYASRRYVAKIKQTLGL